MKNRRHFILFFCLFLTNIYSGTAQWTPLEGPGTYFADFSTGRRQIFASTSDGIFRSGDLGIAWNRIPDLPQHYRYGKVHIGPDSSLLVVDAYDDACSCAFLYRSNDDGLSWQRIGLPGFADAVLSICIGKGDYILISVGKDIFFDPEYAVWESTDAGETWRRNPLQDLFDGYKFEFQVFGDAIWGLTPQELFRGTINGTDWELVADHIDTFRNISYTVLDNTILLHTNGIQQAHLWRSTTGGLTWYLVPNTPGIFRNFQQHNQTLVAFNGAHIIRSDDKGMSWTIQSDVPLPEGTNFLLRWPNIIAYIDESGVGRSTDVGQSFILTKERLGYASTVEKIACLNNQLFCTNINGKVERFIRYDLKDKQWSNLLFNQEYFPFLLSLGHDLFVLDGRIFCSNNIALFVRTDNAGISWVNCAPSLDLAPTSLYGNKMFSTGKSLFVCTSTNGLNGKLLRTDDYGENWKSVTPEPIGDCPFAGVSVAGQVNNTLFAGMAYANCLYTSEDLGETWNTLSLPEIPLETDTGRAYIVEMLPTGKRILLTMGQWEKNRENYFYFVSNDKGISWQTCAGTPFASVRNVGLPAAQTLETGSHTLHAGFVKGVLISADEGLTWNPFSQGLPSNTVYDIESDGSYMYAVVPGHGIWKRPLTDLPATGPGQSAELKVSVHSNPSAGLVRLVAGDAIETAFVQWFDMSGRLCSEETVEFVCGQAVLKLPFPNGTYVYRLNSAGRQAGGKVVLIR